MNAKTSALSKKVTNAVGSAMSLPAKAYYGAKTRSANTDRGLVENARKYKGAPDFTDKGPTDAFKARSMSDSIKMKYK